MKKYISFLLAGVMAFSTTSVIFGANFYDINNVPWPGVETYINQVADAGLMVGENVDGNMVFRAKDPVTLVETAQLVYNLLKATDHLETTADTSTKWESILKESNIPQWAYNSVSYCLETGLLTDLDTKTFVADGTNVQATREQVAGLIGKAIAAADSTAEANSTTTKFGDNSTIATDKIPYIALLSDKNILSGDDLGNFNPKNKINRAEMAVMMTKSNDVLKSVTKPSDTPSTTTPSTTTPSTTTPTTPTVPELPEMPATGTFTAQIEQMQKGGSNTMLALYNGQQVMGYMGDDTVPTTYKDGTAGNFSDVTVGMSVTITYDGSRIVKMVINTDAPKKEVEEQILKGELASIDKEEIRIIRGLPYYLASGVSVTIDGKKKSVKDLIDKFKDEDVEEITVELTLDTRGDVDTIVAKTTSKSYEDSGTIKKLTKTKITFEDGTSYKIDDDDITVKYDGSSMSLEKVIDKINDADDDDEFTAEVEINEDKDDYIERLEVKSKSSSSKSKNGNGTIKSVSGKKFTIGSTSYTTTSSTDFDIDDGDSNIDSMDELETAVEDDNKTIEAKVTVKDDKVTKVTGYVSAVRGDLTRVGSKEVTLKLDSGKFTYECKSSVDIDAGSCKDLADLDEYLDDEGDVEVELTINSSNQVTKIKER